MTPSVRAFGSRARPFWLALAIAVVALPAGAQPAEEIADEEAATEAAETLGEDVGDTPPADAPIADATDAPVAEATDAPVADAIEDPEATGPGGFRIGFWEFDLLAVDREERGTTFRFMDFKIFKLFEVGQGESYRTFSFLEMPEIFSVFTSRQEEDASEVHVLDVEALSLALVRQSQESATESETHVVKLPVLGSVASSESVEDQPDLERQTVLFLIRRDVPR